MLLGAFLLLRWGLSLTANLPAASYYSPIVLVETLKNLPKLGWRIAPVIAVVGILVWRWRLLTLGWNR